MAIQQGKWYRVTGRNYTGEEYAFTGECVEVNKGQGGKVVKFWGPMLGYSVHLTGREIVRAIEVDEAARGDEPKGAIRR